MYKRHSIWDEDKLDIHSQSDSIGYAGHGPKESDQEYHTNDVYGANKPDEDKINEDYRSHEEEEDKEKEDKGREEKEKTIVDTVEQEEKYQKKEKDEFQEIAKDIQQGNVDDTELEIKSEGKGAKKKKNKSIEEAIKEAIKEEKEVVHVD